MRPLRRGHVGPIGRWQHESAGHVQDIRGGEFEVNCGAVGVVDDGRQEGVFSYKQVHSQSQKQTCCICSNNQHAFLKHTNRAITID